MNTNLLARTFVFLFMGISCAIARTTTPNTPAGHTLETWLDAFNSDDRRRMEAFVKTVDPEWSLDGITAFRNLTGGFDLLAIERSEPLHIWFLVKERDNASRSVGDLVVKDGTPPTIDYFWFTRVPPGSSPVAVTLDSALRERVIDGVAADLTKFYVHPAVASQMVTALRAHQKAGAYHDFSDGFQFASRLTADLRAVSHDLHLRVAFNPFKAPPQGPPTGQRLARMRRQMQSDNCDFQKVEILPDDIGYVKFNGFMPAKFCAETFEAAMAFVAHVHALIFDLRDNGGGDPATVAFIASYLFAHPTRLNDIRDKRAITQFWTLPPPPTKRLSRQPVFVLTSKHTFSGAEDFSYALKNLNRATIVGEATGGGAHPVDGHPVADYFVAEVPFAESISPITHTNWEGTGVLPDVKVPAGDALNVAEELATKDIQAAAGKSRPVEVQRTTPIPGGEAAVDRLIAGWENGKPDYKAMGPGSVELTFNRSGALKSATLERVGRDGWKRLQRQVRAGNSLHPIDKQIPDIRNYRG